MLADGPLPLQRLLEIRGFLMYVVRTYPWLNPYMKGMHLTIDSWQAGRAEDDFKMTAKELQVFESSKWANVGLLCRWSDKEEDDGTPTPGVPGEECAPATVEGILSAWSGSPAQASPHANSILPDGSRRSLWWETQAAKGRATPSLSNTGWITNRVLGIWSGRRSLQIVGRQRI